MNFVILGGGPAGVTAAETLRRIHPTASIKIIGDEHSEPYSRMAIPYLLAENIDQSGTHLRQMPNHYQNMELEYIRASATSIDTSGKSVKLNNGTDVPYDKLLIATGATPINPPVPGFDLEGVHTCWTLDDAHGILELADKGAPVVLVGAGFIGCIVLEALHARGCDLTIVEFAPRMVARMMDETAGGMLGRWSEKKGVRVLTNTKVEGLSKTETGPNGETLSVSLSNGDTIAAKLVVQAIGVRSNVGFLDGTDINVNEGITVDEYLQTSVPDVYAAGDCCEGIDLSTGKPDMLAIQPVAVEHGYLAALNMGGIPTPHRGSLNMNVLDTMGLISSSFGLWQGAEGGQTASLVDEENFKYLKLNFLGDQLVGSQCVNMTDNIGICRGLIQTAYHLGEWKDILLESPERLREAYIAVSKGDARHGPVGPHVNTPVPKVRQLMPI